MSIASLIAERIAELKRLEGELDALWGEAGGYDVRIKLQTRINELLSNGGGPLVGMPCTYFIGSDAYAGEVVEVSKSGHALTVKLTTSNRLKYFTRRKFQGRHIYRPKGQSAGRLEFLKAETHLDPEF